MDDKNLITRLKKERTPLPDGFETRQEDMLKRMLGDYSSDKKWSEKQEPVETNS